MSRLQQRRRVGNVRLRNTYRVESSQDNFRVSSTNSKGAEYSQLVSGKIVTHFRKVTRGQTVTVDDAMIELRRLPLQLPYRYGL